MMQDLGYTNVAHMDGGFNAWKASGKPIEEGTAARKPGLTSR